VKMHTTTPPMPPHRAHFFANTDDSWLCSVFVRRPKIFENNREKKREEEKGRKKKGRGSIKLSPTVLARAIDKLYGGLFALSRVTFGKMERKEK